MLVLIFIVSFNLLYTYELQADREAMANDVSQHVTKLPAIGGKMRLKKTRRRAKVMRTENYCRLPSRPELLRSGGEWLVESPRRLQFEKTTLGQPTEMAVALTEFFESVVDVPGKKVEAMAQRTRALVEYMWPRIKKFGNQTGLKFVDTIFTGSTFDGSHVIGVHDADVILVFDRLGVDVEEVQGGYRVIPLRRFRVGKRSTRDKWRFGRSEDGAYLSPLVVAWSVHRLVERALMMLPTAVVLAPLNGVIPVIINDRYTVNIVAATYDEPEDVLLVTRPYAHDDNPGSDMMWRLSHDVHESTLMRRMDEADRGVRRKAYRCLKALSRVEHTLVGLTTYHIKTALFYSFDAVVDSQPRWQRDTVDSCFMSVLSHLNQLLSRRHLPNFFANDHDLLDNMEAHHVQRLRTRIAYLVANRGEIVRVLRKRTEAGRPDPQGMAVANYVA